MRYEKPIAEIDAMSYENKTVYVEFISGAKEEYTFDELLGANLYLIPPKLEDLICQRDELLEALEQLVMINKIYSEDKEHDFAWAEMQNAKQVIAKAKGEQCQ